jgi:ribosomal protein S12 methylthiotransferase accessory factor
MRRWYASRYTGLFSEVGPLPSRPHDPAVSVWAGTLPAWGARRQNRAVGGAGWSAEAAEAACVGEAIERLQPYPLPLNQGLESSFEDWPLDEPAVAPARWVLFHPEQYAEPDFPFAPFTPVSRCRWVCCRQALSGTAWWVPEEFVYLFSRPGDRHKLAPSVSTGLSCGRMGQPVLLRGLQEVLERDAVVGAWWGSYALEEWEAGRVLSGLDRAVAHRILRPNLHYRFYRVASPFSEHVTVVTVEGEDREGFCFSTGSACRETREASWLKAILEAIHGRHYVRYLLANRAPGAAANDRAPTDFPEHAVYYSLHREDLAKTVFHHAVRPPAADGQPSAEDVTVLSERLGPERPVLFRNLTPPGVAATSAGWYVLRVLVPGLQPLHGSHRLPHLGGPLWAPHGLAEWARTPPHPFP